MFEVFDRTIADVTPFYTHPAKTAEVFALGEALKLSAEGLTKCAPTEVPDYICMGPISEGQLPVQPVQTTTQYEVAYSAKPNLGAKVTLHTDGQKVTATATAGVFLVTKVIEEAGKARGYFK